MTCGTDTPFEVGAQTSPAMGDAAEAERVNVPMCVLASAGGSEKAVEAYKKSLEKAGKSVLVESFGEMVHGWVSARGDVGEDKVRREYKSRYQSGGVF